MLITFDVHSTAVEEMDYETDTGDLRIVYTGGGEYVYSDVPEEVAFAVSKTDSVGRFVNQHIKGVYESWSDHALYSREKLEGLVDMVCKFQQEFKDATEKMNICDGAYPAVKDLDDELDAFTRSINNMFPTTPICLCKTDLGF